MPNNYALLSRQKAAEEEFKYILQTYILPLVQYDGELDFNGEPTRNHNLPRLIQCIPKGEEKYLFFFPALETPQFHFRIKTSNPRQELGAAEKILREIMHVCNYDYRSPDFIFSNYYDKDNFVFRNTRFDVAFELGLCSWLGSECIHELIQRLRDWAQKTYEGNHMSFGFIIDSTQTSNGDVDYLSFLKKNHSAVFTDGMSSGIKLDYKGRIVKYFSAMHEHPDSKHIPWTPYEFINFTNMCRNENGSNWIGIIMQSNGDMLIFKNQKLVFIKRNGKWMYLDSYTIHNTFKAQYRYGQDETNEYEKIQFANEVYLSMLDTSFAHSGGCIAIVDDQYINTVTENCFPNDSLTREENLEKTDHKKAIIKRLISTGSLDCEKQFFHYIDRKLRLELLSLDGATVLDSSGRILCVGAIVKINGGSDEGGRLAATKELAKYGLAMKISMDGSIQCFKSNGLQNDPTEVFKTL